MLAAATSRLHRTALSARSSPSRSPPRAPSAPSAPPGRPGDPPEPIVATPPSEIGVALPAAPIAPALRVRALPRSGKRIPATVPQSAAHSGEQTGRISVQRFLNRTAPAPSRSCTRGRIVEEWCDARTGPRTKLASWSVARSMVGLLAGQAIAEGRLALDDQVVDILPWLRVSKGLQGDLRFNDITVRHLLDMTSGIDAPESYEPAALLDRPTAVEADRHHPFRTPDLRVYAPGPPPGRVDPGEATASTSASTRGCSRWSSPRRSMRSRRTSSGSSSSSCGTAPGRSTPRPGIDRPGGLAKAFCCSTPPPATSPGSGC